MKLYPKNFSTVVHNCNLSGISLSRYFLDIEIVLNETTEENVLSQMEKNLSVMESAAAKGMAGVTSFSGLTGGMQSVCLHIVQMVRRLVTAFT